MAVFASMSVAAVHHRPNGSVEKSGNPASKSGPPRAPMCAAKCLAHANRAPPPASCQTGSSHPCGCFARTASLRRARASRQRSASSEGAGVRCR